MSPPEVNKIRKMADGNIYPHNYSEIWHVSFNVARCSSRQRLHYLDVIETWNNRGLLALNLCFLVICALMISMEICEALNMIHVKVVTVELFTFLANPSCCPSLLCDLSQCTCLDACRSLNPYKNYPFLWFFKVNIMPSKHQNSFSYDTLNMYRKILAFVEISTF